MKKSVFIILGLALVVCLAGCGKKQPTLEEMQEPMSMDALSKMSAEGQMAAETKTQPAQNIEPVQSAVAPLPAAGPEQLPVSSPAKPTNEEIQTALNNAGLYTGNIDGKIGPMTRKAVEDFQKAHNLKVDGKVGPQTWALLSGYLNPPAETRPKKKR